MQTTIMNHPRSPGWLRTLACCFLSFTCCHLAAAPAKPRIFLIGDSILGQYRPSLERYLAATWNVTGKEDSAGAPPASHNLDVPTGQNGGDSGMVLSYLRARFNSEPIKADILLLNCGLHDIKTDAVTGKRQVDLTQYRENLAEIIRLCRAANLRMIWVRTTPVVDAVHNKRPDAAFKRHTADVEAYNSAADALMKQNEIPVIDLHGFSTNFIPDGYVDHVHYNQQVRDLQAAFIAGNIDVIRNCEWSK